MPPTPTPPTHCPICRYDCTGIVSDVCPECGATLVRVIDSPNRFKVSQSNALIMIAVSALLIVAAAASIIARDAERLNGDRYRAGLQATMAQFEAYQWKMIQWWNSMRRGEDPGLSPPTYSQPKFQSEISPELIGRAIRDNPGTVTIAGAAVLGAVCIGLLAFFHRDKPMSASTTRIAGAMTRAYVIGVVLVVIMSFLDAFKR